jgi:hypothetical protein
LILEGLLLVTDFWSVRNGDESEEPSTKKSRYRKVKIMSDSRNALQQVIVRYPRPAGVLIATLGVVGCYAMIVSPILMAHAGARQIQLSLQGAMVSLMLTVVGLSYIIFGESIARILMPAASESKLPAYAVGTVLGIIGLVVFATVESYLQGMGYVFHS